MTLRLRPHHVLCLQSYVGKGYHPAFTANFDRIATRIALGEDIELVAGPDDICAPMLEIETAHCFSASVAQRDATAARDLAEVIGDPFRNGEAMTLTPDLLQRLRTAFGSGCIRLACVGCEWSVLCNEIANSGFRDAKIKPRLQAQPETGRDSRSG